MCNYRVRGLISKRERVYLHFLFMYLNNKNKKRQKIKY